MHCRLCSAVQKKDGSESYGWFNVYWNLVVTGTAAAGDCAGTCNKRGVQFSVYRCGCRRIPVYGISPVGCICGIF